MQGSPKNRTAFWHHTSKSHLYKGIHSQTFIIRGTLGMGNTIPGNLARLEISLTPSRAARQRQPSVNGDWLSQMGDGNFRSPTELTPLKLTDCQKNCHGWLCRRPVQLCQIWCTSVHGGLWAKYNQNDFYLFIYAFFRERTYRSDTSDGFSCMMALCWVSLTLLPI